MVYRSLRTGSFFSGIGVADVATVFLGAALQESVGTGSAIGTFECAYACELDASCQHHLSALSPPPTHLFRSIFDFLPDEVERATREIEATSRTPEIFGECHAKFSDPWKHQVYHAPYFQLSL